MHDNMLINSWKFGNFEVLWQAYALIRWRYMKVTAQTFFYDAAVISIKYHENMWKKSRKWKNVEIMSQAYGLIPWVMATDELVYESFKLGDDKKSG